MAKKMKTEAKVLEQRLLADGIYDMWLETEMAADAHPGQFVGVYPAGKATLLPRPISICEVDRDRNAIRLVYRVVGQGTAEFTLYQPGDYISILGVLGNGFPLDKADGKKVLLMGGGIGVPPLLQTAKELKELGRAESVISVLGYRNAQTFLRDDFEKAAELVIATEDGSLGTKGNVIDAIRANALKADVIYACGPMPMLKAIKTYAAENGMKAYVSLEERMACGVGACLGCICKTKEIDGHSQVRNARICTDGPVFDADDLDM